MMENKRHTRKKYSTCFETLPFAEKLHKSSRRKTESLCIEMMSSIIKQYEENHSFHLAERPRSAMKASRDHKKNLKHFKPEE